MDKAQSILMRQFLKFGIVGISSTAIDWIIYFILTRYMGAFYISAKMLSFVIALVNSYIFNRRWTFRSKEADVRRQFGIFALVSTAGMLANTLILYISVEVFQLSDLVGLVMATIIVVFWNFFANRRWTFKQATKLQSIKLESYKV